MDREILLYKRLLDKGIKVIFITFGNEEDYIYQEKLGGIIIVPFYAYTKRPASRMIRFLHSLFLPFIFNKVIKEADILKTNQMWGSWVILLAKMLYRKKVVARCGYEKYKNSLMEKHNSFYLLFIRYLSRYTYMFSDKILLTSHGIANFVSEKLSVNKNKINIMFNYIDLNLFRPLPSVTNNRILFVGRLSNEKNIFSLLDAIKQSPYELDIIGDGDLRQKIDGYIKDYRIKVNLLGRFPNNKLPEILNRYPVYILPSLYEGNPKTLLEAMACGTAVIGSNVEGIKEIIRHNENGLLCGTDSDSIRETINILMQDEELRNKLGRNARKFTMENCSLERIVDKEFNLYMQMVSN